MATCNGLRLNRFVCVYLVNSIRDAAMPLINDIDLFVLKETQLIASKTQYDDG